MQYINKKRAVALPKHYHSINKCERTSFHKQIINNVINLFNRYNNVIYLLLMFLLSLSLIYLIKLMCKLILMLGGVC